MDTKENNQLFCLTSSGLANAGVPLNNKHRVALFNIGTTALVRFVLLDLSACDSSNIIARNDPGYIRLEFTRLTISPMEQITTRVDDLSIVSLPDVRTLI